MRGRVARAACIGRLRHACEHAGGRHLPICTGEPHISDHQAPPQQQRINTDIRVPRVRLIDADGTQVGVVQLAVALQRARVQGLDLVEVAPNADPPVCKIMDHGKHKYQQAQKEKDARRRQSQIVIKEIKMRPKISSNDYGTKAGHVRRFLGEGAKVKATIMFRGREMTHTDLGRVLLDRLSEDMADLATVEAYPKVDGRNMIMVLAPLKKREPAKPVDDVALGETPAAATAPAPDADPTAVEADAPPLVEVVEPSELSQSN